ncbi:MAG: hypothetical protein ABI910_22620, partial [Gemmatimonadota bacterium]
MTLKDDARTDNSLLLFGASKRTGANCATRQARRYRGTSATTRTSLPDWPFVLIGSAISTAP